MSEYSYESIFQHEQVEHCLEAIAEEIFWHTKLTKPSMVIGHGGIEVGKIIHKAICQHRDYPKTMPLSLIYEAKRSNGKNVRGHNVILVNGIRTARSTRENLGITALSSLEPLSIVLISMVGEMNLDPIDPRIKELIGLTVKDTRNITGEYIQMHLPGKEKSGLHRIIHQRE